MGFDVAPVDRDIQRRADLFGGTTCGREPSPRIPSVSSASLRNVQHHTLRGALQLIGQRLIVLANCVK